MNYLTVRRGNARGLLVGAIAALTIVLVLGIKFFMSDDQAYVAEQPAAREQLFKDTGGGTPPPGLAAVARSESTSGGALDMFSKTNSGYYGEEESTGTAAAGDIPGAEVKRSTAPARAKAVEKSAKPQEKKTVIPRMKPASFGGVSPTPVTPSGGGQGGMPDISGMLKQAQEQSGGK